MATAHLPQPSPRLADPEQRRREAELRTTEARTVYAMSRDVANAATALEAAQLLAMRLAREAEMARVWIGLGSSASEERTVADTRPAELRPQLGSRWLLHASSPDELPTWTRVRDPAGAGPSPPAGAAARRPLRHEIFRAPIVTGTETIGSVWGDPPADGPAPGRSHSPAGRPPTRSARPCEDRLAAEAPPSGGPRGRRPQVGFLELVSHDLRTPLAGIRAAAGSLMDPDVCPLAGGSLRRRFDRPRRSASSRLVHVTLTWGGSRAGRSILARAVRPAGPGRAAVERLAPLLGPARSRVAMPADLPAVRVDGLFWTRSDGTC
jgi:hypothetical protein